MQRTLERLKFAENILNCGGYECILCSAVQFAFRWQLFRARTEEVENDFGKADVFEVEQTPIFNSLGHGICLQDSQLMHLRHTNVADYSISF